MALRVTESTGNRFLDLLGMNASEKVIEIAFGGTGSESGSAFWHVDNIQSEISRFVKSVGEKGFLAFGYILHLNNSFSILTVA